MGSYTGVGRYAGIGALAQGGEAFLQAQRMAKWDQFRTQQMQAAKGLQALQMQKLQKETEPTQVFLSNVDSVNRASEAGLISPEAREKWLMKSLDSATETPTQAAYLNHAVRGFTQSGKTTMAGPYADPAEAVPAREDPGPLSVTMTPKQYELWGRIATKGASMEDLLKLQMLKGEQAQTRVDTQQAGANNRNANRIDSKNNPTDSQIRSIDKQIQDINKAKQGLGKPNIYTGFSPSPEQVESGVKFYDHQLADLQAKRAEIIGGKAASGGFQPSSKMIKVKRISDGMEGEMPESGFNEKIYEKVE